MMKRLLISVMTLCFVHFAHAQMPMPNPKVNPLPTPSEIEENDEEQELEAQQAELEETQSNAFIQKTVLSNATHNILVPLASLYDKDTVLIQVPRAEINRQNIWQRSGVPYDASMGVTAYSNVKGAKWQCTELVHRFLKTVYGVPTKIGNGMGHADVIIQNLYNRFKNDTFKFKGNSVKMVYHKDGVSQEPPAPGSVINFNIGKQGHTAVVRYVDVVNESTVKAYLLEQHGYPALKPGQAHGVHAITFNRDSSDGSWSGERRPGTGKSIYWINFKNL